MMFDVNNYVRVQLTDYGRAAHRERHDKLFSHRTPTERDKWYRPPEEDDKGWSRWQLWCLMQEVGWACHNGSNPPFLNDIEICVD